MTNHLALPVVLVVAGLALAGCGGSASTSGATGSVAGTSATLTTSSTFKGRVDDMRSRLQRGLQQVENGNVAGAATVLATCTGTVTSQLGSRASGATQQQAVSQLRLACKDASNAVSKLKAGDTSGAKTLARRALTEARAAGTTAG
jgi:hypothetical protein